MLLPMFDSKNNRVSVYAKITLIHYQTLQHTRYIHANRYLGMVTWIMSLGLQIILRPNLLTFQSGLDLAI